jgi:hypothetical protein
LVLFISNGGDLLYLKKSVLGLVEVEQLVWGFETKKLLLLAGFRVDISTVAVLSRRIINQVL